MMDEFLKLRLERVARRYRWVALGRKLAVCWATAALVGIVVAWAQDETGLTHPLTFPLFLACAAAAAATLVILHYSRPLDLRWVARRIERKHPDLNGVLLTAVQQTQDGSRAPGYFEHRVLKEATARSQEQDWRHVVPTYRLLVGSLVHATALACFVMAALNLRTVQVHGEAAGWVSADGVAVTPGDVSLERGESLVVLARFGGTLPPNANLIVRESGSPARTIPLVKSLADPVFGGTVTEVSSDLAYHVEYAGRRTREFTVRVFEHPRLVRSDVALTFPSYTKLPAKRIEDTRRVSAVEGTTLEFSLQLNKPVTSAKLVPRTERNRTNEEGQSPEIALTVSAEQPIATLRGFVPQQSLTYELQLVDAEGRTNKLATPFYIDVQPNRAPELRLASPRGDVRPSALEEIVFEGTVWDDFGASAYGLAYAIGGGEPKLIELGRDAAAKEKAGFRHVLRLEELGARPDDLISWYTWADDIGPDGKARRTNGDLYFGEVRPFDEIFRESQDMQSGDMQGGGMGGEMLRLAEMQKQIINATWKLQRNGATANYRDDAVVVRDAQQQALTQASEAAAEAQSPRQQALWKSVTQDMEKAVEKLAAAEKSPGPLAQALPAEQSAYQGLLRLQARETSVTRQRNQGGGGGGQMNQRQIDQLDLQQVENRYETQRQARAPQNQERRDQLAVMNRLQELARRQQDLNERLKELQTALQEAQTEQQREEIRRQLKRLEEEQRQMLAEADEVRQRMDRAQNQSSLSQQREQLEQTREDLQRAADAAAEGSVAQALASGTRAQRQLEEMRDELRKQNSSQFAEDLREMRTRARELSDQQQEIDRQLESLARGREQQRKSLSDSGERKELLDRLEQQKERMNELVDRATQISEQAENTEPLLSRQLYDSIRKISQDDATAVKEARSELLESGMMTRDLYERLQRAAEREEGGRALDVTRDMLREGYLPQARQAGQRARSEIDELRRGVERAAESVLGDEAEQLRLARSELDALTDQLQREISQAGAQGKSGENGAGEDEESRRQGRSAGQQGEPGEQPEQGGDSQPGRLAGNNPDSSQPQEGDPAQRSGGQQPGEQEGKQAGKQSGQGRETGQQPGGQGEGRLAEASERNSRGGGGGSERGGWNFDNLFDVGADRGGGPGGWDGGSWDRGPLTGEEFNDWIERLRDVEDLIETPEMRNALAAARERARMIRRDFRQDMKKPDWTVVKLEIVKPLVEVRNRVAEELSRRESNDSLAPIDRDPVPNRYAEWVRRYYEQLGKDEQ